MAACSSEDNIAEIPAEGDGIPFSATISIEGDSKTRAYTSVTVDGYIDVEWRSGEQVALLYNRGSTPRRTIATVTSVSDGEYHWVCGNLIKYGTDPLTENDLPVDQHELIALCAPRACFISTGSWNGDKWQDVVGSFISASKASPVYELLGYKGVGTDLFPGMDNGLMEGRLTYRQHHGGHEAGPNWPFFLDFFQREVVK